MPRNQPRCCQSHPPSSQWMDRLRQQAGRVTSSRRAVLEALVRLARPSTPKEIAAAVQDANCDLATVYRSMKLFESMGLVHRIDLSDGASRFELADDNTQGHHHHHLICRQCERIIKLDDCILDELQQTLHLQYGFTQIQHRLEFFGTCPDCLKTSRTPRGK
ncbi:MAG: Fur family transcriptional regulator [Limisphaerales bacterium]